MKETLKSAFQKLDKYNHKILNIYLIINIIWLFVGMLIYYYTKFSYQEFSITLIFLFIINLLIIIYANVRKKIKFDQIDIFLILLVIFGIIATVFAKDISTSLYGTWKRFEGLFQLLYYYSLFYLCTLVKNKRLLIKFILGFALINSFIAFLQVSNTLKFIPIPSRKTTLGHGLTTNSNFFGSYMSLCSGLSIGLSLYSKNNKIKDLLYLALALSIYSGLLFSNAMSGMVGLFGMCLFIIIYFIYNIIKKQITKYDITKHIVLLISCLILSITLTITKNTIMFKDVKKFFTETGQIATDIKEGNQISDSYGNSRLFIWKKTIKNIPKYWSHGVGIDCLLYVEDLPMYNVSSNETYTYYDKVHNEYLQKLITEGIFSVLTYLSFLLIIFTKSLKNIFKENKNIIYLFLAFIGYCIQAFFNISVIEVAPLFFIISGLLYERKNTNKIKEFG